MSRDAGTDQNRLPGLYRGIADVSRLALTERPSDYRTQIPRIPSVSIYIGLPCPDPWVLHPLMSDTHCALIDFSRVGPYGYTPIEYSLPQRTTNSQVNFVPAPQKHNRKRFSTGLPSITRDCT